MSYGHTRIPNTSTRHSTEFADQRANGIEMAAQGGTDGLTHAQHVNAKRSANPVRTLAGFCKSCDGPIDAETGECRCSA